jgi:arginase family enzyme
LYCWDKEIKIYDLGNLIPCNTVEDTYAILTEVIAFLIDTKIIPFILGGSNDLVFPCYKAYEQLEQVVNLVSIDSTFDLGDENEPMKSNAYLNKIILQQPNYLLNFANIGYQTYMNSPKDIEMMDKLYFETFRVGVIRQNIDDAEPIIRNSHSLSIDISAIRRADAPANPHGSSNGFYGEEICKLAFFAGMNDNLSSIGLYEYDPTLDYHNQTAQVIAHIIWYFVEGFINRQNDLSFKNRNNYIKHAVSVTGNTKDLIFHQSKKTGRWWVVVPIYNLKKEIEQKHYLPCSKSDFDKACSDQVPERWWKAFQRFNR